MIVDVPAWDYLRFTTYAPEEYELLRNNLEMLASVEGRSAKVMQYDGVAWDSGFAGEGRQNLSGEVYRHFLVQSSGEWASRYYPYVEKYEFKCTRCDIQLTLKMPEDYVARELVDVLRSGKAVWKHRKRQLNLVESDNGLDTVYIGSRKSDRVIRFYVKMGSDGRRYLRFEVEYKGVLAPRVWGNRSDSYIPELLHYEFFQLPQVDVTGWRIFGEYLEGFLEGEVRHPKYVQDENRTLLWLERQVQPAVKRLANSHDHNETITRMLSSWLGYAKGAVDES